MEYHDRTFGPEDQCGAYVLQPPWGANSQQKKDFFDFMKFWAMKVKSLLKNLKI